MKTLVTYFTLIVFLFSGCSSWQDRKIEKTVNQFWNAVEDKNIDGCIDLFHEGKSYSSGIHMQVDFLNKNYDKFNSYAHFKENIIVKDTTYIGIKSKYVQYKIPAKFGTSNKDLTITFLFYKPLGGNKIINTFFLSRNFADWRK